MPVFFYFPCDGSLFRHSDLIYNMLYRAQMSHVKKTVPLGRRRVLFPRVQIAGLGKISSLVGPKKLTGAHDPRHVLQKNGGLADQWYMDDGDIMCHPILVLPFSPRLRRRQR